MARPSTPRAGTRARACDRARSHGSNRAAVRGIGVAPAVGAPRPANSADARGRVPPRLGSGSPRPSGRRPAGAVLPPPTALPAANFAGFETPSALPANPAMAAGPTNLVAAATGQIALFAKTGDLQTSRSLDEFFGGALSSSGGLFDPRVVYDPHVQRFFVLALDGRTSPSSWLRLAVSKSSTPANLDIGATPAQDWWGYDIDADRDGGAQVNDAWADFAQIGFDQGSLYVTANMRHSDAGNTFAYVKVWILPTDGLIDGGTAPTFELGAAPASPLANPVSGRPGPCSLRHARSTTASSTSSRPTGWSKVAAGSSRSSPSARRRPDRRSPRRTSPCRAGAGRSCRRACSRARNRGSTRATRASPTRSRAATDCGRHTPIPTRRTDRPGRRSAGTRSTPTRPPCCSRATSPIPTRASSTPPFIPTRPAGRGDLRTGAVGPAAFAAAVFTERLFVDAPGVMRAPATLRAGDATYNVANPNPWGTYGAIAEDPDTSALWLFHEYAAAPNEWGTWFGRRDTPPPPETTTTTSSSTSTSTTSSTTTSSTSSSTTTSSSTSTSTTSTSTSTTLAVTPRCQVLKLNGAGKEIRRILACYARAARIGAPVSARCLARAGDFGDTAFARAEAVGRCPGTADTIAGITTTCTNRILAVLPGTGRCTALKRMAVGTAASARLICRARALHLPNGLFNCLARRTRSSPRRSPPPATAPATSRRSRRSPTPPACCRSIRRCRAAERYDVPRRHARGRDPRSSGSPVRRRRTRRR